MTLPGGRQAGLDHSLCQDALAAGGPLIFGDTRQHPVLAGHPVVRRITVLAYAGIPLTDPRGHAFGTFCVIDFKARHWDHAQLATLARLADIATEICVQHQGSSPLQDGDPAASSAP